MRDWRLVLTVSEDVSINVDRWFRRRALILHEMRRERHNHTVRFGDLERELDAINYEITDALAAANPQWEPTDGSEATQ